ncbi:flagellar basal body L-ring protein FlgH [Selenomonas ruminis]|uniref:flagellar basal body L-ring protein FlgH n=1 Tax=Selenomonas ruminis TaxID=2593411 RepID=UPI003F723241
MRNKVKHYKKLSAALAMAFTVSALAVPAASAQSLWSDNGSSYNVFADRKARQVGDILTIVISESTSLSATKASSNSKSGNVSLSAGVGIFDFLKAASASGSDSFKANGSATSKNTTSGNVTVTVVDVQPNGNMTVEGTQSIWQNRNEHKITFRGVCRQDDVSANNTIMSTKIADATVKFDGKGPLNSKQRQGILTQVFNFLF